MGCTVTGPVDLYAFDGYPGGTCHSDNTPGGPSVAPDWGIWGSGGAKGCPQATWCVLNDGNYRGQLSVTDALATSPNTAFAKLISQVGVQRTVDMAVKLGLRSYALPGTARDYDPESNESLADFVKRQNLGSFTLGPIELNALELSNVAATLASGGKWCPPSPIDKVFDRTGTEVSVTTDTGVGSLRDAVSQANANAGPDTITFAPGLSGLIRLTSGALPITANGEDLTITGPGRDVITVSGDANASNTPFRLYKHWQHEGGISTPLIAHWPGKIDRPGSMTDQPGHLIDIMATCVEAGRAQYPKSFQGDRITPLEGLSLVPVFQGKQRKGHSELFWEHEGNRAVRQGKWKLVSRYPGDWELYDLEADRTEMHNLAEQHPAKVRELTGKYEAWAAKANVVPWGELKRS